MKEFHYQTHQDYDKEFAKQEYTYQYYSKNKVSELALNIAPMAIQGVIGKRFAHEIGSLSFEKQAAKIPVYSNTYSALFYQLSGYLACEGGEYLAVIKLRKWLWFLPLILLLFVSVCFWLFTNDDSLNRLDPNAKKYVPKIEYSKKKVPNQIQLPGYNQVTMVADTKELYVALWNPETNPCYFQFTLSLDKKVIYQSGLVSPGDAVTTVELNQTVPEGNYPLQIKIDTFDLKDDTKQLNGGSIEAQLVVNTRQ
ncbi:hypothetical protein [Enterococcus sp. DIV1420a]|uniref:hypothetical protein n=1 Tax=Enterococcus sp. DIV1420a TaxID=2774672 RepID=UPI003F275767